MSPSDVTKTLDSIQAESFTTDAERHEAMEAARRLVARLETPFERTFSLVWAIPALLAGLRICQDLGIWQKWTQQCSTSSNIPQSLDKILAMAEVPVEANLLRKCEVGWGK